MTLPNSSSQSNAPPAHHDTTPTGRIVIFGEVLADVFPARSVLGGAPFNVACHLKAFGQSPVLITRLGTDTLRDEVLEAMQRKGLDTLGVQFDTRHPTGRVMVHLEESGHRFEILPEQAYDYIQAEDVQAVLDSIPPQLVYFGTLAQRNTDSRQALATLLQAVASPKFLDINLRPPWYDPDTLRVSLTSADIVKLNETELGELVELFALAGSRPADQAQDLMRRFDLDQVLVTCGDAGAWHLTRDGDRIETRPPEPLTDLVDTVGAGDGFASIFILGNLNGWPIGQTLERAHAFAAAICRIRGAIPDQPGFYDPFKKAWSP